MNVPVMRHNIDIDKQVFVVVNPFGMRRRLTTIIKECVVKLFTEAYKLKHKPQWTPENRWLKSKYIALFKIYAISV
jgi:hypothetical protein